jgi:hypothetical protein
MPKLGEVAGESEDITEGMAGEVGVEGIEGLETTEEEVQKGIDFIAKSLDKNLSDYNNHPMIEGISKVLDNSEAEDGLKQVLRGIEGVTGKETQLAIMDILTGGIRVAKSMELGGEE